MIKRSDWEAAYRELITEGRRGLGEPPTEEQLLAYSRNELDGKEAERVQEYLSFHPEIARALVSPFPSPEEIRPGDPDYLSGEILEEDWKAIQARLAAAPEKRRGFDLGTFFRKLFMVPLWRLRLVTATACGLAAVLGWIAFQTRIDLQKLQQEMGEPRANLERRLLLPDGERDAAGEETSILLRSHADHYLLDLNVAYRDPYPEYRLRIVAVDGPREKEVWSAAGLRRDGDSFEIWMPRSFLKSGDRQRLEIYGVRAGKVELLAAYTVQLQDS